MATRKVEAEVVRPFTGAKEGNRVFLPGDAFEGTEARVSELRDKGFLAGTVEDAEDDQKAEEG